MKLFCSTCKTHVEVSKIEEFHASGHDNTPRSRTQRDVGRLQRPEPWTRGKS